MQIKKLVWFVFLFVSFPAFVITPQAKPGGENTGKYIFETFQKANELFNAQDFSEAGKYYQIVLDSERISPRLPRLYWYVLVDYLGISYGATGRLAEAEQIFRYGISEDPEYALFYFNMACVYGEKKDLDKCIDYLKLAYHYKNYTLPRETLPDPVTDNSFTAFVNNQNFIAEINTLKEHAKADTLVPGLTGNLYKDHLYHYSISFPNKWQVTVPTEDYHIVRCNYGQTADQGKTISPNFSIMSLDCDPAADLKSIAATFSTTNGLLNTAPVKIRSEEILLNGHPCLIEESRFSNKRDHDKKYRQLVYFFIQNHDMHILNFTSDDDFFEAHKDEILGACNSFRFIGK